MSTEGIPGSRPSLPHETSAHQLNVPASRALPQATRLAGVHASPSSCPKRGRGMRRALVYLSRGCLVRIPASFLGEVSMANPRITRLEERERNLERMIDGMKAKSWRLSDRNQSWMPRNPTSTPPEWWGRNEAEMNRIGFEADDLQRQLDEVRAQLRSLRMR